MIINEDLVQKIAHLSRLDVAKDQEKEIAAEMSKILNWMEQLNEVNTDSIEPLIHVSSEINVLRNDEIGNILPQTSALKNAPLKNSNYFRVPKVIE